MVVTAANSVLGVKALRHREVEELVGGHMLKYGVSLLTTVLFDLLLLRSW